jgi:GNAT superfamily N-acetyltransferase
MVEYIIRPMVERDAPTVIDMMRTFYASPAVLSNGSEEIFEADVAECVGDSPYAEGFVFEAEGSIIGYGMLAKSYSTEFGRRCIWIEDLYLLPEYRGLGIGSAFFAFVEERYPHCLLRLEVEEENERARHVYEKNGFDVLPYMEMKKHS